MSTSSNHTKAFVQCCHGKHTVASSRTLLFVHVCQRQRHVKFQGRIHPCINIGNFTLNESKNYTYVINPTEQSNLRNANSCSDCQQILHLEHESSSPCSQNPANGPYIKPNESRQHSNILYISCPL